MTMRCLIPPENWNGYASYRSAAFGIPTASINSMALCFAFDFSMDPLKISASEICFPIFMIGFSADRGSWNTSEIRFPLIL